MKALVSVVMPVYNAARYLATAIDSICNQTLPSWELLCLDDGSTDETREIVIEYARRDPRVSYVGLPHRGLVCTLNEGVRMASGNFIARMDADDLAVATRLEKQLKWLERNLAVEMVGSAYHSIDSDNVVGKRHSPPVHPEQVTHELRNRNCLCHPAMMMRAESLRQLAGPYRQAFELAEDYDLWLRAVECFRIGNISEVLLHYRRDLTVCRPARTVTQTISRLGCQISAQARSRREPDPAEKWKTVDCGVLIDQGLRKEDIHFEIRRSLLSEARQANKQGLSRNAELLLQAASCYAPKGERLRRHIDFLWRRLQVRVSA